MIRHKVSLVILATLLSVAVAAALSTNTYAVTRAQFANILCSDFQGPSASGGTVADECKKDARDGTLSKKWHDKAIKFADWKNKSAAQLYRHVGKTPPSNNNNDDTNGGDLPSGGGSLSASSVGIPQVDANDVVKGVLNTVYFIAGAAAIIIIIIGGVLYATSEGDPSKVQTAKNAILYAVVGLIVVMMAFVITGFVIGRF